MEINKNLEVLKNERSHLEYFGNVNSIYSNNNDIDKLKHEINALKSDNIMYKEELNMINDLNKRLDSDLNHQRLRK